MLGAINFTETTLIFRLNISKIGQNFIMQNMLGKIGGILIADWPILFFYWSFIIFKNWNNVRGFIAERNSKVFTVSLKYSVIACEKISRLSLICFVGISLFWDDFPAFRFLKRFPISFSDMKLKTNLSLDSRFSLILVILGWFLYLHRIYWTESPITCLCKLLLPINSGKFKFGATNCVFYLKWYNPWEQGWVCARKKSHSSPFSHFNPIMFERRGVNRLLTVEPDRGAFASPYNSYQNINYW